MDKLIISETDRGRYAVRPMSWAGIFNEKGQIKESLNHLALFIEKEDAEKFVEWKNAEEQNRLLKLPCAVGDKIYLPNEHVGMVIYFEIIEICIFKEEIMFIDDSENEYFINDFGKTVFLTKEAAESALKELERGKGE